MPDPHLSIVVPTLNEADTVGDLLRDLAPWRSLGDEVILVDGDSRDATREIAAPLVDRLLTSRPGRAAQMNTGAAASAGGLLWFLHADSRVAPAARDALRVRIDAGARWGRFDVRLSGRAWPLRLVERTMNLRSCLTGIATGDQGIFVERRLFEAVGGFPDIALMEDIGLSKRLKRTAPPACIRAPRLLTSSRHWETRGTLRTIVLMWRLRFDYWRGADPDALAQRYRA
jgi:rSAM/selenodomain-associated transferase 2